MKKILFIVLAAVTATLTCEAQTFTPLAPMNSEAQLAKELLKPTKLPTLRFADGIAVAPVAPRRVASTLSLEYNPVSFFVSASGNSKDEYFLTFTSVSSSYDSNNNSVLLSGPGISLYLDLYNDNVPTSTKKAVIPEGDYISGNPANAFTYDSEYTFVAKTDENNKNTAYAIDGAVNVKMDENYCYTITAHYKDENGDVQTLIVPGVEIAFRVNGSEQETGHILPQYNTDVNSTFTASVGIYYGNLYQSNTGNMLVNLYDGDYNEETGTQTGPGNLVQLCLFANLFANPAEASLQEGTYKMARNFSKFSYYPGTELTYGTITAILGCQVQHRDENGYYSYGCIVDGKADIDRNPDGTYTITVDMVTDNGYTVKGSFTGAVRIIDYSDDKPVSSVSNLTEDVDLDLNQIPVARLWRMDDVNNCGVWTLDIGSRGGLDQCIIDNGGDIVRFELVSETQWKNMIPDGTYDVLPNTYDQSLVPFSARPGYFSKTLLGELTGTCYQHMEEGRYLVMDLLAPAASGSISLKTNADGTHTVGIDLVDDAGFMIRGSWTGPVELQTEYYEGISTVKPAADQDNKLYDLSGRRVNNPKRGGIYIVGGRKVVY